MNQEISSTAILQSLKDVRTGEIAFRRGGWNYRILRSRYDDETDFLYILNGYGAEVHAVGGKAEFAGIYSHVREDLFAPCYDLRFLEVPAENELANVTGRVSKLAKEAVLRKVIGVTLPETDEAKQPWYDREYFLKYMLDKESCKCFLRREVPSLDPDVTVNGSSAAICVRAINHPEELAEELAEKYICEQAKWINQRQWEISMLKEKIAWLEAAPGEHHIRRSIRESVDSQSMKSVALEIDKNGRRMTCRIEAHILTGTDDADYSTWRMNARGRMEFFSLYGQHAKLYPRDISRITYGRKVLYMKEAQV